MFRSLHHLADRRGLTLFRWTWALFFVFTYLAAKHCLNAERMVRKFLGSGDTGNISVESGQFREVEYGLSVRVS